MGIPFRVQLEFTQNQLCVSFPILTRKRWRRPRMRMPCENYAEALVSERCYRAREDAFIASLRSKYMLQMCILVSTNDVDKTKRIRDFRPGCGFSPSAPGYLGISGSPNPTVNSILSGFRAHIITILGWKIRSSWPLTTAWQRTKDLQQAT